MRTDAVKQSMVLSPGLANYDELVAGFKWDIPERFNLATEICDRHAIANPDAVAVIEDRGSNPNAVGPDSAITTFAELRVLSARIAGAFVSLGLAAGDRVAVVLPQSAQALAIHLACFRLGLILVPVASVFPAAALGYRLIDSGARIVVADSLTMAKINEIPFSRGKPVTVAIQPCTDADHALADLLDSSVPVYDAMLLDAAAPAIMFYTSGTTGEAKGAVLANRFLFAHCPGFQTVFDLAPRSDDLFWTPSDWAWLGALEVVYPALYFGRPVVASAARFNLESAYRILSQYRITCAFLAPTVLRRMRSTPPSDTLTFSLRVISTGGEALANEVQEWILQRFGASLNDNFGLTEANHLAQGCSRLFRTPQGAIGLPVVGRDVAFVDADGNRLAARQIGEMVLDAGDPVVMLGYWNKPEKTGEKLRKGWFWTGDLGYQDENGFIYFLSRSDDVFKISGMQVAAEEVEKALLSHDSVEEVGICPVHDEQGMPSVAAFVKLRHGIDGSPSLSEQYRQLVRQRVAAHACPRHVFYVQRFPMTSTGKIQRKELTRIYSEHRLAELD